MSATWTSATSATLKFDPGPLDRNTLFGPSSTGGGSSDLAGPHFPISRTNNLKTLYRFYSVVSGTTESWGFEESNSLPHYLQSLDLFSRHRFEFGYAGVNAADSL